MGLRRKGRKDRPGALSCQFSPVRYAEEISRTLCDDQSNWMPAWTAALRSLALDVLSLQAACELIREKYFDGERVLLEDAKEEMEKLAKTVRHLMAIFDEAVSKLDRQLAVNCDMFRRVVSARTSTRAEYIGAIARGKMLEGFGDQEAADAVLRPYLVESLNESGTDSRTDYLASPPTPAGRDAHSA